MIMNKYICASLAFMSAYTCFAAGNTVAKKQPNIIFFLVDDMGWMDIGANGSSFYETPNIDKLASEGVRFVRSYTAPVSSPSRASIFTGRNSARVGITQYIGGSGNPDYVRNLPLEEVCFPEVLKEKGYTNIFLGKWHLNNKQGENKFWPDKQGFDINLGGHWRGGLYIPNNYFSPWNLPNLENGPDGEYMTDRLANEAVNFIDTIGNKPFMMFFSFYSVHAPFNAPKELVHKYEEKAKKLNYNENERFDTFVDNGRVIKYRRRQDHPVYAAMVESVDRSVGKVIEKLRVEGLEGETIIIFSSDNGGLSTSEGTPTSNYPLKAGKGWLYEGGIRVPTIVKWPGVSKSGFVSEVPITCMDFYPTILEMANIKIPHNTCVDGVSIVPLLKGSKKPLHKDMFFHYPHHSNQKGLPSSAIVRGDYKLIVRFEDGKKELYNLKEDVSEENNIYHKNKMTDDMYKTLKKWWKEVDAKFPKNSVID